MKKKAIAFVDGASRGNPGAAAAGVVFQDAAGSVQKTLAMPLGIATNNVAEYYALLFAMQEALMQGAEELQIFTDSELVARQFAGQYKIKEPGLKLLFLLVSHLKRGFKKIEVSHVPREKNKLADAAANQALDGGQFFL